MGAEVTAATRILIVCNPNNPTATTVPLADLEDFLAGLPRHVCVIVDEAYIEFATDRDPDESVELLRRHPNVVLLRTFSKVYGLCGLRAGYALAAAESFRAAVDRVRQPFSVNALAQAAATEALAHQDEVASRVERTVAERLFLEEELRARGLATSDSQANFAWVDLGEHDEAAVLEGLAERGVIVRGGGDLGERGRMRVTYGTHPENARFLSALDQVIGAGADT
jgi:histidinol-phosphate aminotransferase